MIKASVPLVPFSGLLLLFLQQIRILITDGFLLRVPFTFQTAVPRQHAAGESRPLLPVTCLFAPHDDDRR